MVNVLRTGGVEVEQATKPFSAGERTYPAGSYLIRGAQTFRPYLNDLLNPQEYPDHRKYPDGQPDPRTTSPAGRCPCSPGGTPGPRSGSWPS